ncbi:hypothetical protein CXG53_05415 [Pseudomonas guariconensis]|uniref:Uncharacterized protein n=1 Tax=Pseudomonas guariconensis TaxID=1288410 RepID=A0AAX0VXS1_9PSED|nr:hypothetical protein CXG49_10645 [Pseudomonas guariconensis]PLV25202.1 hypothetical protein CXG53_05415 [Pseudomonas guariconensis]PLV29920.1 hypothetical protein CXG51_07420 [Pseudomonas guariconensis]
MACARGGWRGGPGGRGDAGGSHGNGSQGLSRSSKLGVIKALPPTRVAPGPVGAGLPANAVAKPPTHPRIAQRPTTRGTPSDSRWMPPGHFTGTMRALTVTARP